jgi:hypothetical protein
MPMIDCDKHGRGVAMMLDPKKRITMCPKCYQEMIIKILKDLEKKKQTQTGS